MLHRRHLPSYPTTGGLTEAPSHSHPNANDTPLAGCGILADGLVGLPDGSQTRMRDIHVGDELTSPSAPNGVAAVACVVRYQVEGPAMLCNVKGCWLTPDHMVKVGKKWLAPRSVSSIVSKSLEDGALFNIMLQRGQGHSILVNGAECVPAGLPTYAVVAPSSS